MEHFGLIQPTPDEIERLDHLLATMHGSPFVGEVAPHLVGVGEGKRVLLYPALQKLAGPEVLGDEPQTRGDCAAKGTRDAGDLARAVEIVVHGDSEAWITRGASEPLFSLRGHSGDGMAADLAVECMCKYGLMFRKPYPELGIDLTEYNSRLGDNWSREQREAVMREMARYPFRKWVRVETVSQMRDCLTRGMAGVIGSHLMATGKRDENGYAGIRSLNGGGHLYPINGFDFTDGKADFTLNTTWGPRWINGGHPQEYKLPPGGWKWRAEQLEQAARTNFGGMYAVGEFDGPPPPELEHFGIMDWTS